MRCLPPTSLLLFLAIWPAKPKNPLLQIQIVRLQYPPVATVGPGKTSEIILLFKIEHGYHIQADTVNDDNLISAVLTVEPIAGIALSKPTYPDYREFQLKGTNEKLLVFDGELKIVVRISAAESVKEGSYALPGSLYYQACDSVRCLFPRKLRFNVTVNTTN